MWSSSPQNFIFYPWIQFHWFAYFWLLLLCNRGESKVNCLNFIINKRYIFVVPFGRIISFWNCIIIKRFIFSCPLEGLFLDFHIDVSDLRYLGLFNFVLSLVLNLLLFEIYRLFQATLSSPLFDVFPLIVEQYFRNQNRWNHHLSE